MSHPQGLACVQPGVKHALAFSFCRLGWALIVLPHACPFVVLLTTLRLQPAGETWVVFVAHTHIFCNCPALYMHQIVNIGAQN